MSVAAETKRKWTQHIMVRILSFVAIIILAIVAMIIITVRFSGNIIHNMTTLENQGMTVSQAANQAYRSFLSLEGNSNLWVGSYTDGNATGSQAALQQALDSQQQLNLSLTNLHQMLQSSQDRVILQKTVHDVQNYESTFKEVQQLIQTNTQQAQHIQYISAENLSHTISVDLTQLAQAGNSMVQADAQQTVQTVRFQKQITYVGGGFVGLLGLALFVVVWILVRPIPVLSQSARRVAEKDLTVPEIPVRTKDEVGDLTESFNLMVQSLEKVIKEVGLSSEQLATAAEQLMASAEQTSQATENIAMSIQEVASGSEQQAASTESVVTTIGQIGASIGQIAQNAQTVAASAGQTDVLAKNGSDSIAQVKRTMQSIQSSVNDLNQDVEELGHRSQRIGEIVQVITEIARQTNLLALNAAIEAARAGQEGRGFAVVADEVRKLAVESSQSAKEITEMVQTIQQNTQNTILRTGAVKDAVEQGMLVATVAGTSFADIEQGIGSVASQIEQVYAAVQEISAGTEAVNKVLGEVSQIAVQAAASTENVSAAAEEQLASMEEITASATSLSEMADQLHTLLSQFQLQK